MNMRKEEIKSSVYLNMVLAACSNALISIRIYSYWVDIVLELDEGKIPWQKKNKILKKCRVRSIFPANQPIGIGKDMNILVHVALF